MTLHQELMPHQYNEEDAVDLVLQAGQILLHDAVILHDSEANTFAKARRGMTLRLMPTTSIFDRDRAREMHESMGIADLPSHALSHAGHRS